ncbi:MarR family winged helix-turn-helix transcriptional regulator [Nocardia arthritidis]|uniref:MarR family winged helix-turn-helix transcriptional regulator n=1 Tax=Nocardia arthritidis TaxID=228602 RepID=UPI00142E1DE7|nr:MarR family transcriptional regulator [Nocardia arthritidis]
MSAERDELVQRMMVLGREMSTVAVMHHAAVGERLGISAAEGKTLELLQRLGPLTPGELAKSCGLAANTTTYLVARLEKKGYIRRSPHPHDSRKVLLEVDPATWAAGTEFYVDFSAKMQRLLAGYTPDQLRLLLHFSEEVIRINEEAIADLAEG